MTPLVDVQHLRSVLGYPPHDCHVQGLFEAPMREPLTGEDMPDTDHLDDEAFDSQLTRLEPSQVQRQESVPLTQEF